MISAILGHPVDLKLAAAREKMGGVRIIGVRCDSLAGAETRRATAQSGQRVQIGHDGGDRTECDH